MGNNRRGKGGGRGGGGNYYGGGSQQGYRGGGGGSQGSQGGGSSSSFGFGRSGNQSNGGSNHSQNNSRSGFGFGQGTNSNNSSNYNQNNSRSGFGFGSGNNQSTRSSGNSYQQSNRFSALSSGRGSQGNRYGGSKPQPSGGTADGPWQEVVKTDWFKEGRIMWYLTCYGHLRETQNDMSGDTSPEEVRWAQMQALKAGKQPAQLVAEYKTAVHAKEQELNALLRAQTPPSLAAPAVQVQPEPQLQGSPVAQQAQSGFGRPASQFGQPAQAANSFGQKGATASRPSAGFGFGQAGAAAGSHPFGRPAGPAARGASPFAAPPGQSPFGSSSPAPSPFAALPAAPSPFGAVGQQGSGAGLPQAGPGMPGASPAFGQLPSQADSSLPANTAQALASPTASAAATAAKPNSSGSADVWALSRFQRGQIPETAPAPVFCK